MSDHIRTRLSPKIFKVVDRNPRPSKSTGTRCQHCGRKINISQTMHEALEGCNVTRSTDTGSN